MMLVSKPSEAYEKATMRYGRNK
ncbi:hypothetical protein Gotur_007097 [Gossypium turneri]